MLADHPQIFIPKIKEPNYFALAQDKSNYDHYINLFSDAAPGQITGEGSQLYSAHEFEVVARNRILEHNPDIKLIFMVRNPMERIESSFREFHHSGPNLVINAPFTISEALEQLPALILDTHYWQRVNCYRERVPDTNILVVFLEELKHNPSEVLEKCYAFLGVETAFARSLRYIKLNASREKLYDSRLLRAMRTNPFTGFKIARIPIEWQNRIFSKIGLRRSFRGALHWDPETRIKVIQRLQEDAAKILHYCGKPADFWPEFNVGAKT